MSERWVLAIDFGTTSTVVAARRDGRAPEVIELDGERRLPSVVLVDATGAIAVGRAAEAMATANPDRVLRRPKNRLGVPTAVVLGGKAYPITDLVAAILDHVHREAVRYIGSPPAEVRLTYPASWSAPRREDLLVAATKADLPNPVLVPEPIAAAIAYADEADIAAGSYVLVYDLGGGTFDTAALRAEADGFVVVGRPIGDPNLGGELFDELVANHIGEKLDPAAWEALQVSDEHLWQLASASLRSEARRVKEVLSSHPEAEVVVPLPNGIVNTRITRHEFDDLVRPHIQESIDLTARCATDAGLRIEDLAAVYLVGGASRSPIVADMVGRVFPRVLLSRRGDPKAAVALGATHPGIDVSRLERRVTSSGATTLDPPLLAVPPPPVPLPPAPVLPAPVPLAPVPLAPVLPAPGLPVAAATPAPPAPVGPAPFGNLPQAPPAPPKKNQNWLWAAIIGTLIIALIVGALALTRDDDPSAAPTSTASTTASTRAVPTVAPTGPAPTLPIGPAPTTAPAEPQGEFVALAPARIVDTRSGVGAAARVQQLTVNVAERVPVARAKSVVLNVSVAEPSAAGYLVVFPSGAAAPEVSQLAFSSGRVASSLVVSRVNAGGQFEVRITDAVAHMIVDLVGYFAAAPIRGGLSVVPEPRPRPLLDTRSATPVVGNGTLELTLPEGQRGALLGVTATRARGPGFLTVYSGENRPNVSNLNFTAQIDATAMTIVAAPDRKVRIFNGSPTPIDLVVFQVAKLTDDRDPTALELNVDDNGVSDYPFRTFDSRAKDVICTANLGGGVTAISTVFPNAKALLVSITVVGATVDSFMQVYSGDTNPPDVAVINFEAGERRSNLVFVPVVGDRVNVRCGAGTPHYLFDVLGEFN